MKVFSKAILLLLISCNVWAIQVKTLSVNKNQTAFTISLTANPSTGYQWRIKKFDKELFDLVDAEYVADKRPTIGGPGIMNFIFHVKPNVLLPTHTNMIFEYGQVWQPGSFTDTKIVINFN